MSDREELLLCCDCQCLDHVAIFNYYPLNEDEIDSKDNEIYMTVPYFNLNRSFSPFYLWGIDLDSFLRFNFYKRFYYAFMNIFNPVKLLCNWKTGILDCFDFQEKDHDKLYDYLCLMTDEKEIMPPTILEKKDSFGCFDVYFYVDRLSKDSPYLLQYSINFREEKLWNRIKNSVKYVFGTHHDTIEVPIRKHDAAVLKSFLSLVKIENEVEENKKYR